MTVWHSGKYGWHYNGKVALVRLGVQFSVDAKFNNSSLASDVPARAWPESPGFGLALGGLGLRKL